MKKHFFYLLLLAMCVNFALVSCRSTQSVSQAKATGEREVKDIPCAEWKSTKEVIRSQGMAESLDQQIAREKALSVALTDMASKIEVSVKAVIVNYAGEEDVNKKMDLKQKFERMAVQTVDQAIAGYRTVCEKFTINTKPDGSQVYKCYYAIELDKEDVARSTYKGLTKDESLRLNYDYEKFKEEFEKQMLLHDKNR